MRQEKLGYPFSYGDELTPEMARENRKAAQLFVIKTGKKTSVYLVFTYTVWSTNIGFGKSIQSYSSFSKQPKTEIVRVVSSRIRGGDLGKSGPGARAKADAARKARKDSIVVDAYSPHNIYCRYHQNCAQKSRLGPLFDRSNTPTTQLSREERRELNRQRTQPKIFDKNITILSQDLQLTTPVDLSQEVSISDAKQTGKSQRTVELLKKTLAKKYSKHRKEFQNPNNSPITSKAEFFDAQVRHFQDSKVVRIPGIYLSKDHDPLNCSFYLNPETNQLISVREHGEYGTYVSP